MRHGRLGTTGDHDIGITVFNEARGVADAMGRTGASADDGDVRAFIAIHDRKVARDHVDDRTRHKKRRNLADPRRIELVTRTFNHWQAADPRTDGDANPIGIGRVGLQTGIFDRFDACRDAVVDEKIHAARILGRDVLGDIEIANLAGNVHGEAGGIETGNPVDSRTAGNDVLPSLLNGIADR